MPSFPLPSGFQHNNLQQLSSDAAPSGRPTSAVPHSNPRRFPHLTEHNLSGTYPTVDHDHNGSSYPMVNNSLVGGGYMFANSGLNQLNGGEMSYDDEEEDDYDDEEDDTEEDAFSRKINLILPPATVLEGSHPPVALPSQSQGFQQAPPNSGETYRRNPPHELSTSSRYLETYPYSPPKEIKSDDYLSLFKLVNIKTYNSKDSSRDNFSAESTMFISDPNANPTGNMIASPIVPILVAAKPLSGMFFRAHLM